MNKYFWANVIVLPLTVTFLPYLPARAQYGNPYRSYDDPTVYCDNFARNYARRSARGGALGGAARGALGGVILGGIFGGRRGVGRGAAAGALFGAVAGGARQANTRDYLYRSAFNDCLRGYSPYRYH